MMGTVSSTSLRSVPGMGGTNPSYMFRGKTCAEYYAPLRSGHDGGKRTHHRGTAGDECWSLHTTDVSLSWREGAEPIIEEGQVMGTIPSTPLKFA